MEEDWTGLLFTPCAETKEGRSDQRKKLFYRLAVQGWKSDGHL